VIEKQIILSLVFLSQTTICKKLAETSASWSLRKPGTHILYQLDFEGNNPFPSFITTQVSTAYALQLVDSPVYHGKKAARFELRDTDPENNNGKRAEISFPAPGKATNPERWYAFAVLFPREDFDYDNSDEVICQWHQGGKATPSLCIRTKGNQIRLRVKAVTDSKEWIDIGEIEKNVWQYYVIHIKHSSGPDGLIEIWRDNKLLVHNAGANMYDISNGAFHIPNWKLGIYKSAWNSSSGTSVHKRVLYFDDIKMGDEHASFSDMIDN
jgi:hypothetical protein